jgi:hypothetical protein
MATGVEKTHPRSPRTSPLSDHGLAKNRGFGTGLLSARRLARELRLLAKLPVPRSIDFSYSAFSL